MLTALAGAFNNWLRMSKRGSFFIDVFWHIVIARVVAYLMNSFLFKLQDWASTDRFGVGIWIWVRTAKVEILKRDLLRDTPLATIFNEVNPSLMLQTQLRIFLGHHFQLNLAKMVNLDHYCLRDLADSDTWSLDLILWYSFTYNRLWFLEVGQVIWKGVWQRTLNWPTEEHSTLASALWIVSVWAVEKTARIRAGVHVITDRLVLR